jgi:hypothetical protein
MAALFLTHSAPASGATPTLELRDGGKAAISLLDAKPGDSATGCVVLAYRGDAPARVRLYGTTRGTGFDRYLDLEIERGSSCVHFRREAPVFRGPLAAFPDGPRAAIEERWSPGEIHAFRFEIVARDENAAQGLETRQTFTWTADGDDAPLAPGQTELPGSLARPPGPQGLGELLTRVAQVAAEVGKRSAFPSGLLVLVVLFLSLQNRIDRRDPKLALAPVHPTPDLPFGGPEER